VRCRSLLAEAALVALVLSLALAAGTAQAQVTAGGETVKGGARLEATLAALPDPPLPLEPSVTAGGRTWNLPEAATVSTERLTAIYRALGRDPGPLWTRLSALVADHTPSQIICLKELERMGDHRGADLAWVRARRADPRDARAWADNDPAVGAVRARAD